MDIDALQYIKLHRARIVIVIGNQTALVQFGMQLLIGCSGIFGYTWMSNALRDTK